jgi:YHS domain-containing protein
MKAFRWIPLLLVLALALPLGGQEEPAAQPALGGLDPVSVVQGSPQAGEERFSSVHGRFRYVFASAANKEAFDRDPERWGFQLDGLTATTFYDLIPALREAAPKTRIVSDQRYVDNGKIITTAGLSSGIDGSLHVVERMLGRARAQQAALNMEYDWRPDSGYARASLADAELRRLFGRSLSLEVPDGGQAAVLSTEGTRDRWEARWEIKTATSLSDLQAALTRHLTETGRWTPAGTPREWRFTDAEKRGWKAIVDLQPAAGKTGEYQMAIRLERAGA